MRISDKLGARLQELGVELRPGVPLSEKTSLGIGGSTDQLLLRKFETIPDVMHLLANENIPHRFLLRRPASAHIAARNARRRKRGLR